MTQHAARTLTLLATLICGQAQAQDLFRIDMRVNNQTDASAGFSTLTELLDSLSNAGLSELVSSYTPSDAALATLYIRGLPAVAEYQKGASTLYFRVPSLGLDLSFAGSTRDASQDLFKEWIKGNGATVLSALLRELVRVSPVDPVAGNPNSLMGQMVGADFGQAMDSGYAETDAEGSSGGPGYGQLGLELGRYSAGGYGQNTSKLPLGWTWRLNHGMQLKADLPLSYISTEGAKSGQASLGGQLQIPLQKNWLLTPALRVGATGSEDLGAAALMYSASLTSRFMFSAGSLQIGITNMVAGYRTRSLTLGDYTVDYQLSNTSLRNAVDLAGRIGEAYGWRAWIIDTRFYGDALYCANYQEYGVAGSSLMKLGGIRLDKAMLGLSYLRGQNDVRGVKLNFGYKF